MRLPSQVLAVRGANSHFSCFEFGYFIDSKFHGKNLRAGQRIGNWSPVAGRHGILGMEVQDVDRKRRFITVRLKGARDQHGVPVTDDFWPIYEEYLRTERRAAPDLPAVWIASWKGQGKPLRYASFESALRFIGRRAGISVHPYLFRHTLAQGVLETTGNIKAAQEILGHSHLSTTADLYLRVDQHAMVTALAVAKSSAERTPKRHSWSSANAAQYVVDYDDKTISELNAPLCKLLVSSHGVEILDVSDDVCTYIMPRKST
jgi:hypothetical protein